MYSHRQAGHVVRMAASMGGLIAVILMYAVAEAKSAALLAIIIAMGVAWLFGSMTIEVKEGALRWWFGPYFWKKSVPLSELQSAEKVRNKWWWGWGIRYYGKGWLYNVSGLDAVEITLKSGKKMRLGTDDPEGLVTALQSAD
jgi:hypothetical protein